MRRRDFLISVAGAAGSTLPVLTRAAGQPCPPPSVSAVGGTTATTTCGASAGALTTLRLASSGGMTGAAWTFGQAFREGHVPAGSFIGAQGPSAFQAAVKNRWPDGSVKFAVLSGIGGDAVQLVASSASAAGSAVSTAALASVSASISFGGVTASWAGADWNLPFQSLVTGPVMSSWTFRKAIGADAHLVAWLEVRAYSNGAVEVLPWVENGFLNVASPGTKSGRAVFTLGGTTRYDSANDPNYTTGYGVAAIASGTVNMWHHSRAVLVNGGKTSHWLGADPGVVPSHDRTYLESTNLVPRYRASSILESRLATLTSNYSPMRTCYLEEGMGAPGYAQEIGLIPNQAAMYVVSGDSRAFKACVMQGFSLGSYSIHYRDETTQRPLLFASYPTLSTNSGSMPPAPSGAVGTRYASSHHPAAAYMPYLLTGWNWFVEEVQFQVTLHYLARSSGYRQNEKYYFYPSAAGSGLNEQGGPRAQAWQWRTCAMAACITPDSDSIRSQFISALGFNANYWRIEHETGAVGRPWAPNELGCIAEPGYSGAAQENGKVLQGSWQDDFVTASIGFSWDLKVLQDAARLSDLLWLRNFKYKAITGRLGQQNVAAAWNFQYAAQYQIYIGTPTGSSSTFNWYANWGEAFAAKFGQQNLGYSGSDLRDGNIGGKGMSQSYWGNLQPAIAYAVDHGAPGAAAAYQRMVGASNFAAAASEFQTDPVWGVMPHSA